MKLARNSAAQALTSVERYNLSQPYPAGNYYKKIEKVPEKQVCGARQDMN